MKKRKNWVCACMILCGAGLLFLGRVMAAQPVSAETAVQSASVETVPVAAQETETDYLAGFRGELDFSGLDDFFGEEASPGGREPLRFSGLVDTLLSEGLSDFDGTLVVRWLADTLFYEISENRRLLAEVVVLAVAFSIFKNFSGAFKQSYIAEISFFLVYGILAVLLLQSFTYYEAIVAETLQKSVDFMKALVPTFCISMAFSSGTVTSAGFYQTAFVVIYLIQWLFLKILMPLIHGYLLLVLFRHFFEEEKFENLAELLKGIIEWSMKSAGLLVVGMNVVQGLLAPAKDRLMSGTMQKAAEMIPGVGTVAGGIGEMLLGSGILIKNCVGVAALVALVALCLVPLLKILCISFFYKLGAVVAEPVADRRMAGCMKGMAEGGILYLKLVLYCLALFLVTVALTTAASGLLV